MRVTNVILLPFLLHCYNHGHEVSEINMRGGCPFQIPEVANVQVKVCGVESFISLLRPPKYIVLGNSVSIFLN
jgi:hypothetical protein